jgi:hypothetical protein
VTTTQAPPVPRQASRAGHPPLGRTAVGGFVLVMGAWCLPALALLGWLAVRDLHPGLHLRKEQP